MVWLEGDCNNTIRCLKGISPPSWTISNIITKARDIIYSFENCHISHGYGEVNAIANWVANVAVRLDGMITL